MDTFESSPAPSSNDPNGPWWRQLNSYHWFVLVVAALGWLFDTMDQQLFNLARVPAMQELVTHPDADPAENKAAVAKYAGFATSIFLIGWATGGIAFGVMGDRIGRAKTMLLTILLYSLFTGLSALSRGFWDFALYRFLTGLGVGGEFAVGVSLVAEVMPDRARPFALGFLQALSAVGNITAALISIVLGQLEESGAIGSAWRIMFVVGTLPALLAVLIRRRLKEPERWQTAVREGETQHRKLGSYAELFRTPRWRRNAIVGVLLASSGVIGLWGIGFFSIDLNRSVFRADFQREALARGAGANDMAVARYALEHPDELGAIATRVTPDELIDENARSMYASAATLHKENQNVSAETVLAALAAKLPSEKVDGVRSAFLKEPGPDKARFDEAAKAIEKRTKEISGRLTHWAGITSVMINFGAFFGIYGFSLISHRIGRRPTFAIGFILAMFSTAVVFWYLRTPTDVYWMIPIMGFCQLSLFGGYAVYFPELFPTHLRSTGTSFCYNVGRFVAALGPSALGLLQSGVFKNYPEPMRYAGVTMCAIFVLGLVVLPFAPETRGQPLPE